MYNTGLLSSPVSLPTFIRQALETPVPHASTSPEEPRLRQHHPQVLLRLRLHLHRHQQHRGGHQHWQDPGEHPGGGQVDGFEFIEVRWEKF